MRWRRCCWSACLTCGGLGVHKLTHPELLVPDPRRSVRGGCFVKEAFRYNPDTWDGRIMYSLSRALGFSLDSPWEKLPDTARQAILYGVEAKIPTALPPEAKDRKAEWVDKEVGFGGIARRIERHYRRYRQRGEASSGMEAWLEKVMVEHTCPDCNGARVRSARLLFTVAGKTIHEVAQMNFDELHAFLGTVKLSGRGADADTRMRMKITTTRRGSGAGDGPMMTRMTTTTTTHPHAIGPAAATPARDWGSRRSSSVSPRSP